MKSRQTTEQQLGSASKLRVDPAHLLLRRKVRVPCGVAKRSILGVQILEIHIGTVGCVARLAIGATGLKLVDSHLGCNS